MRLSSSRWLALLVAGLVVLAPAAEAAALLPVPPCAQMMRAGGEDTCCGSSCECEIGVPEEGASFVVPSAAFRFELSSARFVTDSLAVLAESIAWTPATQESPPEKLPLYQVYSDYRL
jgi:hypothetical protein